MLGCYYGRSVRVKIKTNELTGSALDRAVAKCEGYEIAVLTVEEQRSRWFEHVDPERLAEEQRDFDEYIAPTLKPKLTVVGENGYKRAPTHQEARTLYGAGAPAFSYTTSWAQSGPIIDREKVALRHSNDKWYAIYSSNLGNGERAQWCEYTWVSVRPNEKAKRQRFSGPTPLIAAMRCYVASRLSDEVDVPETLL